MLAVIARLLVSSKSRSSCKTRCCGGGGDDDDDDDDDDEDEDEDEDEVCVYNLPF